ncbi:MAG: BMC domain-containing protein [bacterium]
MSRWALGLIETKGLVGSIEATDAAAKAAAVVVASAELTPGTLMTIRIEGELGAVQAAVEAGARAAERVGELYSSTVIPNPDDGLSPLLPLLRYVSKYHPDEDRPPLDLEGGRPIPAVPGRPPAAPTDSSKSRRPAQSPGRSGQDSPAPRSSRDLDQMSVVQLRRLARSLPNLGLRGREISKANKQQLIDAIKRVWNMD